MCAFIQYFAKYFLFTLYFSSAGENSQLNVYTLSLDGMEDQKTKNDKKIHKKLFNHLSMCLCVAAYISGAKQSSWMHNLRTSTRSVCWIDENFPAMTFGA